VQDLTAIERELVVPVPPEEVWPAVTEADEISAWFGADVELDARPGGRGTARWADGTERHLLVEDVEPAQRLAFRWLPFQRTGEGEVVPMPASRVEIELDAVPEGTRIRVVERPAFRAGPVGERTGGRALAMAGA
jgi:uncharacterized protein YndB with AHSA1/START domain